MADHPGIADKQTSGSNTGSYSASVRNNGPDAGNLALIAQANEGIKQVRRLAEDISLIATNAMLVARRAGDSAVGFRVVARELRSTSDRMASAMEGLGVLVYQLVLATARCRGSCHRTRTLDATAGYAAQAAAAIGSTLRGSRHRMTLCQGGLYAMVRELDAAVRRTGRHCDNGIVIARSAAIEAVYGGTMQPLLRQIAEHFEASIERLAALVRSLREQLREIAA